MAKELDKLMNEKIAEAAAKMTAALTPVLVKSLELPQSIAVMVGSLIVKRVAKGTSDFICENWKQLWIGQQLHMSVVQKVHRSPVQNH